jgi:hypothetical protein
MSSSKKRPSSVLLEDFDTKKIVRSDIVGKLMSDEGDDPEDNRRVVYKCLREGCGKIVPKIKKSGFSNPFFHLVRCYGSEEEVYRVYKKVKEDEEALENRASSIKRHFSVSSAKSRERAMHAWIILIVLKGVPLNSVEDNVFRSILEYSDAISIKALIRTIFQLVILVEQEISKELADTTCGAIMHDARTRAGIHYVALFACYVKEKRTSHPEPCCTLLSVAPMPTDGDTASETVTFNADAHSNYFRTTLSDFYNIDITKWCKAIMADNTKTNIKITKDLGIPHVGCYNHKLNLDVEAMVRGNFELQKTISNIHDVMACAKQKLRNAAVLRNITDLRPILENKTHWSGKVAMIARFIRIRDDLMKAADHEGAEGLDKVLDQTTLFLSKAKIYEQWMTCINTITKKLQEHCLPLTKAHHLLDILEKEIVSWKDKQNDPLYECTFKREKSSLANRELCPNKDFETGVVKIQLGKYADMTDAEKRACRSLKKQASTSSPNNANGSNSEQSESSDDEEPRSPDFEARVYKYLEERESEGQLESPYVNCNFIYGSTAEVERLWSVSSYILTKQRRRMTPQLFEAILFLRYNERFWNLGLVVEAMKEDRMQQYAARVEKLVREDETGDDILQGVDALDRE